ncbi:MAG: hypothetical protein V5A44_08270 [Haloarculaceae archaeon]
MATEPLSDVHTATERDGNERPRSAWWAEVALGVVCSGTAAVFALGYTAIGPFSDVIIIYPTVVSVAYLALASLLALVFLQAGFRHSPWSGSPDGGESGWTAGPSGVDEPAVSRSRMTSRTPGRSDERGEDR